MKKNLNQKLINLIEYYNLINNNLFLDNFPIKRNKTNISKSSNMTKVQKLKLYKNLVRARTWDLMIASRLTRGKLIAFFHQAEGGGRLPCRAPADSLCR